MVTPHSIVDSEPAPRGAPYCGDCGYDLSGCVDSPRCPECGRPLVEVLMRPSLELKGGRRWRSRARIGRMPVIDIAFGPHGEERYGRARGFIALGDQARGVLAFGGQATGVVAFGGMAIGGLTFGGLSIGLFQAIGGMAIGGMAMGGWATGGLAQGGGALGWMAQGGFAAGYYARGGGAFGTHVVGRGTSDPVATAAFDRFGWFFGGAGAGGVLTSVGLMILLYLLTAGIILAFGAMHVSRGSAPEPR